MTAMTHYIKKKLEQKSVNPDLFHSELKQAIHVLITSEIDELAKWFVTYTKDKPQLRKF